MTNTLFYFHTYTSVPPRRPGQVFDVHKDYYSILSVDKCASAADIKSKYKQLALQFHPDKARAAAGQRLSEDKLAALTAGFKDIREAYDILIDEALRAQYDELVTMPPRRMVTRLHAKLCVLSLLACSATTWPLERLARRA